MKRKTFVPRTSDRKERAKSQGIIMRPNQPKISGFVFLPPSVDWDSDKEGYVHQHPTYRLKGCDPKKLTVKNPDNDLLIEMRRTENDSIKVVTSDWFLKNVSKEDTLKIVNYYVEMLIADTSMLYERIRGTEQELKKELMDLLLPHFK